MISPPGPSLLTVLLAVLMFGGIIVIARWSRNWTTYPSRIATVLSGAWSPVIVGIVCTTWNALGESSCTTVIVPSPFEAKTSPVAGSNAAACQHISALD